mgnify:FL=1
MRNKSLVLVPLLVLLCVSLAYAQANGKLQIHFIDVGQGDGAVLISPQGEVVLFDNGVRNKCDRPVSYLQQLGVTQIDYHITSHYHADHIGCTTEVLTEFPLQGPAFDRGKSYGSKTFEKYLTAIGSKRQTATAGMTLTLDAGSSHPVKIEVAALNGAGVSTTNENDLSLVAVVHFGKFDVEIGGDLSGIKTGSYEDIESPVADKVGEIEVYKVHHHGSRYSSNETWLTRTNPIIGIISTGDGNSYGHPTQLCLDRLHAAGVKTYWTESGAGATPIPGQDIVGGHIIVEVEPGSEVFTVTYSGSQVDTYAVHEADGVPITPTVSYAWSKKSKVYHYSNCVYVDNIKPANLEKGDSQPAGKRLHKGCPK